MTKLISEKDRIIRLRFRYPRHSVPAIALLTGLPTSTVQHFCERYVNRGHSNDLRASNGYKGVPISASDLDFITSQ